MFNWQPHTTQEQNNQEIAQNNKGIYNIRPE